MPCPDFLMFSCGFGGIGFLVLATKAGGGGGGGKGAGWRGTFLFLTTLLDTGACNLTGPALSGVCGNEVIGDPFWRVGRIPFVGPVNCIEQFSCGV